ncbi:hypothetical protein [Dyadobacter jiangsuensis]|uniref:HEAT repeat protein n=1 Tax=Dyadobacter jiangsuensis TaxID=1591085 RepID=A0A2P8FVG3_9BACT|nr:hypothetical protein [Dyadobacter jiangsuensis]PSL25712.1 hypothetical protein CLV60_111163 [Dyadobacter jiangsuensis]
MIYKEVPEFYSDTQNGLDSNDPDVVLSALLSTVMKGSSYDLSVSTTSRFLSHPDKYIRGAAVECISHIARIWNIVPVDFLSHVNLALNDSDGWVKGKAENAVDDLEVFIKGYKRPKTV